MGMSFVANIMDHEPLYSDLLVVLKSELIIFRKQPQWDRNV